VPPAAGGCSRGLKTAVTHFLSAANYRTVLTSRSRRSFFALARRVGVVSTAGRLLDSDAGSVLAAGRLATALDAIGEQFQSDSGTNYYGAYHGSNAVVQMVLDRSRTPTW